MARVILHVEGCTQNNGPFWGTLKVRGRRVMSTQKGIIILTTPAMNVQVIMQAF